MSMERYDGIERRKMSQLDHDLLQQISNDTKHIVSWSEKHEKIDDERFRIQNSKTEFQQKIIYGMLGVFIFIEFVFKVLK